MDKFAVADKNLFHQRYTQHVARLAQIPADHPAIEARLPSSHRGIVITIMVGTNLLARWIAGGLFPPEQEGYGIGFRLLIVGASVVALLKWTSAKKQQAALIGKNNEFVSAYLYAAFSDIQPQESSSSQADLSLFYSSLQQATPDGWIAAKIANISVYFHQQKGVILGKDNTVHSNSPLIWGSSPLSNPKMAALKQQFGYFPELEQAGHFYSPDRAEAAMILKQKEHFLLQFTRQYRQELLIVANQERIYVHLAAFPTQIAFYREDETIPNKPLFASLQQLARLLADFEQL